MRNLHVIGDSHAREYTWDFSVEGLNIICHHLGPKTAASFGVDKKDYGFTAEDWVCFCFGEIDCRDNVGRYENWKAIIRRIADDYFYAISLNRGRKFVLSVPPAVIQSTAAGDPWPCTGTDEERREYVHYMNGCFRAKCLEYGYTFFDVHDKYAENGFFNLKYRDHCVHIADPVFLKEFLQNEQI